MKRSIVFLLTVMLFIPMAVEADMANMVDNTAKAWFERGIGLEEQNKHKEAIEAFTKSIEIDPLSVEAYFERGKISFAHDRTRCLSSLKDFTKVIDLEDDNAEAYYERALVNFYMINNEQGRKDMEKAASLGHKGARDWLNPPQKEERVTSKVAQVVEKATAENPPVVNFDFNSAAINPSYLPVLDRIGIRIQDNLSRATITAAGHADAIGSDEFNNRLSIKRAEAVKKYLMETYRIPPELILIEAYGESRPLVPNDSEENRALNRRVEIAGEE